MVRVRSGSLGVAAAIAGSLLVVEVGAFGDAGHRVVGFAAELHLADSRALREVRRILRPNESLADASVWPDVIQAPGYEDEDAPLYRLAHPGHETYHYTNIPFQAERYDPALPGAHATDVVWAAREAIRVLRGRSQAFRPRAALRLLAHLVGDIHQPLHVGNAFIATKGERRFVVPDGAAGWRSTLGGNALRYGPNDNFSLHSYWDVHAVNLSLQKRSPAVYAARLVKERRATNAWRNTGDVETWPAQWATEVLPLARRAYSGIVLLEDVPPDPARRTGHRWRIGQPAGYDDLAREAIPEQLARGGYRLAAALQAIWPD